MPSTNGSSSRAATAARTSASVAVAESRLSIVFIPHCFAAACFSSTYLKKMTHGHLKIGVVGGDFTLEEC